MGRPMVTADIPVKPMRKTLRQTAIILNVSERTVRRYLDDGKLQWSGNQVSVASIAAFLQRGPDPEEHTEDIEAKLQQAHAQERASRRPLAAKPRGAGGGWVSRW